MPDSMLTEMTAHMFCSCDEADCLLLDLSVLSVNMGSTSLQLSVTGAEHDSVSGPFTGRKRLMEEAKQKTADDQYELDWAKLKITQFGRLRVVCR